MIATIGIVVVAAANASMRSLRFTTITCGLLPTTTATREAKRWERPWLNNARRQHCLLRHSRARAAFDKTAAPRRGQQSRSADQRGCPNERTQCGAAAALAAPAPRAAKPLPHRSEA